MNLIVDIGNTSSKLALYDKGVKKSVSRITELNCRELDDILSSGKAEKAIVSSTRELPEFIADLLFHSVPSVHVLTHRSALPFRIEYETPDTLGTDRIAAVAGAYSYHPGRDALVIDAGTAITYDLLLGKTYKGGNISPGVGMRFRALNQFTGKLPLLSASENYSTPGRSTSEAVVAGVMAGVKYEINEYIRTFEEKYPGIRVIITGGDGPVISGDISFRVDHMPDLVLDGLNYILEYNAK